MSEELEQVDKSKNLLAGFEESGGDIRVPIWQYNFQAQMFMCNFLDLKEEEIFFQPFRVKSGVRRNYERKYDPKAPVEPPACYTTNGTEGSAERVMRELLLQEENKAKGIPEKRGLRAVYGNCSGCYFKEFGSDGSWGRELRGGPNCKNYALAFGLWYMDPDSPESGIASVIQVPPTGVTTFSNNIKATVIKAKKPMNELLFVVSGSGGGRNGDKISAAMKRLATPIEAAMAVRLESEMDSWMTDSVERFCAGRPIQESDDSDDLGSSGVNL